jgi:peptidoglycan/xylan/chitin deacetylase (PgdA/CDA1 family)
MGDLLILCYHAVSADWPTEFAVAPTRLGAQVRHFLRRGYRPATRSAALDRSPREKTLVVTFDDAFASVRERAFPVLSDLGVPATVFVPTAYVAEEEPLQWSSMEQWAGTPFADELRCMSWDGLRALIAAGWEVGSHSVSHLDLTSLGDAELDVELRASRAACEAAVQRACETLAYPFSAYDRRVMERARLAGYRAAAILDNELAIPPGSLPGPRPGTEMFALLREGVYRRDGQLRMTAKTSPLARRARASHFARVALRAA